MKPTNLQAQQLANALSTTTLLTLHAEFPRILSEDDALAREGKPQKYGVRIYADFRTWANAIENALDAREEAYQPINW